MRYRNLIWLGIGALIGGLIVSSLIRNAAQQASQPSTALVPANVLETSLPDLEGVQRPLGNWQGKVLVVNFWATWCPPCLREIPDFIRLQDDLGERGLQFIGIAMDDVNAVREFVPEHGINYPILLDDGAGTELARALGDTEDVLPFTAVFDRNGTLQLQHAGAISDDELRPLLERLLAQ